jgi:hypothetical protein
VWFPWLTEAMAPRLGEAVWRLSAGASEAARHGARLWFRARPHECASERTRLARRVPSPRCTRDARERYGPEVEGRGKAQDDGRALRVRERRERWRPVVWARSVGQLARPCAGLLRGRSGCGPVSGKRLRGHLADFRYRIRAQVSSQLLK